jgi:hypothetical protein
MFLIHFALVLSALMLQGYDSIPREIPDPKAKEVCLVPSF